MTGRCPRTNADRIKARWPLLLLIAACGSSTAVEHPPPQHAPVAPTASERPTAVAAPAQLDLYAPDEALRDVLSGELEYLGTKRWTGIERLWTCVFRNQRVFVVDVYCTASDSHAMRVDVFSPERGYIRIYAEATGPISLRDRALYFTFNAASEPPPAPESGLPPLALTLSYDELRDYDQRRYDAFLPGCYAGTQNKQPIAGCLGTLAGRQAQWSAQNRAFLEHASGDWYRVVQQLRALAARHGRDPD